MNLEIDEYDRIVSALYEAALDSRRWGVALENFRALFKANYVTLILKVPDLSDTGLMISVGELPGGIG